MTNEERRQNMLDANQPAVPWIGKHLAGCNDRCDGDTHWLIAAESDDLQRVVDRLHTAAKAAAGPLLGYFLLSRRDVHLLALRLNNDAATIAELRAELERVSSR